MTALWRGAGVVVAAAAAATTAWLSQAPLRDSAPDQGLIRLAFGVRAEQLEHCRRVSADELAKLPPHMRQTVICEGHSAHYRLRAWVDARPMVDVELTGGGVQHDRPIHALEDIPVAPGTRHLRVEWRRIERPDSAAEAVAADSGSGRERRDSETRARRRLEAAPAEMVLEEALSIGARQVVLVTYFPATRRLATRRR